jgi:hypothetical protein
MVALLVLALSQTACAVYTVASGASLITTEKSLGEHALTQMIPYSDCGALNLVKGRYYCEIQDPSKTYNRSGI